jgi:protein gp37
MADKSRIEWTEATWNPVAGCSIISPGCKNCYAMRMAWRLNNMGVEKYRNLTRVSGRRPKWTGNIRLDRSSLDLPLKWKKGRLIFVNSMSDLFHEGVPLDYIQEVFAVMEQAQQHTFQVLTKRPERARVLSGDLPWPDNVWLGTSVENAEYKLRIEHLHDTDAKIKFLSLEPLIGDVGNLNLDLIDWVIAGGESGPGARPMEAEWVRSIRNQCIEAGVAFHFKQWGGTNKHRTGRLLDNRYWNELPQRVRDQKTSFATT